MPDHAHILWMGISPDSDQLLAARFLRKQWNALLLPLGHQLQTQAHDRVLRHHECRPDSFEDTVLYIRHNPQRAGLVNEWQHWLYGGAIVPGYPELPIHPACEFWGKFWKIHNREVTRYYSISEPRGPIEAEGSPDT
ncbi:hypothetical protein [Haloferula sp. BvORR071]|uniref:hypothetical protein n=1 Tax=Haloferula sp. BvORR071 TaxID=1396141 RepID=UPI002240EB19|nr:hypothetical protein [Haloferula sp. BvORR071]